MTLSPMKSRNLFIATLAMVWTTLSFGAAITPTPAFAKPAQVVYSAELAAPATDNIVVAGGIAWRCAGTTCTATKSASRPAIMCKRLVRKTGPVTAFTFKGEALAADKLARCND